jgi:MFS family permease
MTTDAPGTGAESADAAPASGGSAPGGSAAHRRRAVLPDLAPWRASRDFRLLWVSGSVSMFGSFVTVVALPLQAKQLTGSTVAVGAIGAAELVPMLLCGLYGGALADALDRRRVVLWTELALGVLSLGLLVNTALPGRAAVWPLYAVAALSSAFSALQQPALDAIVPRVTAREHQSAATALNSLRWQIGGTAGPAAAGLLAASLPALIRYDAGSAPAGTHDS